MTNMTNINNLGQMNPADLHPHPINEEIYNDRADNDLIESIKDKGIYTPILVTLDGTIVSGHRRWDAATKLGLASVPTVFFASTDPLEIELAVIENNKQRVKTNEQIAREYIHLKELFNRQFSRAGQRPTEDLTGDELPPVERAAKQLGVSRPTADKAAAVVTLIDELRAQDDNTQADVLQEKLKASVNNAYNTARSAGLIEPGAPRTSKKKKEAAETAESDPNAEKPATKLDVLFSSDSVEHTTPKKIVPLLTQVLGEIDLDPCSNDMKKPAVKAKRIFTKEIDGLKQDWVANTLYMNPPYGTQITPWIEKLRFAVEYKHVLEAIALVPARVDTAWWNRLTSLAADQYPLVCFVRGRLKFGNENNRDNSAPFPSAFVYFGENRSLFYGVFSSIGQIYGQWNDEIAGLGDDYGNDVKESEEPTQVITSDFEEQTELVTA